MLTNTTPSDKRKISKVIIDIENLYIELEIKEGYIDDNSLFVADGRSAVKVRIINIEDKSKYYTEDLTVDVNGQVTLTETPITNNQVTVDGVAQDHTSSKLVTCADKSENDIVTVSYYYTVTGRNWFYEAIAFISDEHAEYAGLSDYAYISKRLWTTLLNMGIVEGNIV